MPKSKKTITIIADEVASITPVPSTAHRWSGWPGAWCLDCGVEDLAEVGLANGHGFDDQGNTIPMPERFRNKPCPEPNSNNHNPYARDKK